MRGYRLALVPSTYAECRVGRAAIRNPCIRETYMDPVIIILSPGPYLTVVCKAFKSYTRNFLKEFRCPIGLCLKVEPLSFNVPK